MANQIRYILKRIVYSLITILVLVVITFLLMQLLPGDPFTGGKALPDNVMAGVEAKYGLDKSVPEQLFQYIANILHGDFGISIPDGRAVSDVIGEAFPVSFDLGIRALIFAFIMGVLLGIVAAVKRGTVWDSLAMFIALVGVSVPSFIMGALLQYFLGLKLYQATGVQIFAIIGWADINSKLLPPLALAFGYTLRFHGNGQPSDAYQYAGCTEPGLYQNGEGKRPESETGGMDPCSAQRDHAGSYCYGTAGSGCPDRSLCCGEYFLHSGTGKIFCAECNVAELYHDCGNHSVLRGIPDFCQSGCRHYLWPHRPAYQTDRQKGVRA